MKFLIKENKSGGFTLIELLVVISILGILSGVVIASVNTARIKARDAKRMSDIRQIDKAIQMYMFNENKPAPSFTGVVINDRSSGWPQLELILANYIKKMPQDPLSAPGLGDYEHTYLYYSPHDNYDYGLGSQLEKGISLEIGDTVGSIN